MKTLLLFYVTLISYTLTAQNLVVNGGFECGDARCDFVQIASWYGNYACQWYSPNAGTPDVLDTQLYNKSCWSSMPFDGTETNYEIPHVGSQLPRSGSRFAGFTAYSSNSITNREYITGTLYQPLVVGKSYCVKAYISRADNVKYSVNNIGFFFHQDKFYIPNVDPIIRLPMVNDSRIIDDGDSWILIEGVFHAKEPSNHFTIGNLGRDDSTLVKQNASFKEFYSTISYYVTTRPTTSSL